MNYGLSIDDARMMLVEELRPRKDFLLDDDFEEDSVKVEEDKVGDSHEDNK